MTYMDSFERSVKVRDREKAYFHGILIEAMLINMVCFLVRP